MNIPDEAVEAAARAAYEVKPATYYLDDSTVLWEQLSDSGSGQSRKDQELAKARAALEAAAPYIRALSWDDGYNKGKSDVTDTQGFHVNPDRKYL